VAFWDGLTLQEAAGAEPAEPRAPADLPRGDDDEPAIDESA
jgi:hypothetical protein